MSVEGNAPIIALAFKTAQGSLRTARFLFDSGGGAIILSKGLAKNLGLKAKGAILSEDGQQYQEVYPTTAFVDEMPVDLRSSKAFVYMGAGSFIHDRDKVEGMLPGKALQHYQIVLDYSQHRFSIGEAGSLPHQGEKLPCPYVASSGHPRLDVVIDGIKYGFLLDTGTQITLMRDDVLKQWSEAPSRLASQHRSCRSSERGGRSGRRFSSEGSSLSTWIVHREGRGRRIKAKRNLQRHHV